MNKNESEIISCLKKFIKKIDTEEFRHIFKKSSEEISGIDEHILEVINPYARLISGDYSKLFRLMHVMNNLIISINKQENSYIKLVPDLELLFFLNNLKSNLRVCVSYSDLMKLVSYVRESQDVYWLISPILIYQAADKSKGNYSNKAKHIRYIDSAIDGSYILYISKSIRELFLLWISEYFGIHNVLGSLLGYPNCCINHYIKYLPFAKEKFQGDFVLISRDHTHSLPPFSFYINNLIRYFNHHQLIYHFPCNYECDPTIEIAKHNFEWLKKNKPKLAKKLKCNLLRPIIYSEYNGIVLFCEYETMNDKIEYNPEKIILTDSTSDLALLRDNDIIYINENSISIGRKGKVSINTLNTEIYKLFQFHE